MPVVHLLPRSVTVGKKRQCFFHPHGQNAIPADMKPADLCQMTISDWEEKLGLEELTIFE